MDLLTAHAVPAHNARPKRRALRAVLGAGANHLLIRTVQRARGFAQSMRRPGLENSMSSNESESSSAPAAPDVRVMRWVFTRADNRLTCELALADDHACYELKTSRGDRSSAPTVERFVDVSTAFERQSTIEGTLVKDGWSLESYESVIETRAGAA